MSENSKNDAIEDIFEISTENQCSPNTKNPILSNCIEVNNETSQAPSVSENGWWRKKEGGNSNCISRFV